MQQKLEAKEQELRGATRTKMLSEVIALIEKERDGLIQDKRDMRQQLSALQAQLAGPSGEVLAAAP